MKYRTSNHRKRYLFYAILLWSLIWTDNLLANQAIQEQNLSTKIAYNYLRSFTRTPGPSQTQQMLPRWEGWFDRNKIQLAESTQRKVVLRTIFSTIGANHTRTHADLLNYNAWTDLTLFCGPSSHPTHHLLSRINRTTTVLGECALATLLTTPTSDLPILSNRQQIVQLLLAQPACLSALKEVLATYRTIEPRLLSLWTTTDPLYTKEYREYMRRRFLSDDASMHTTANKLNRRVLLRNCRDIYSEFALLPSIGLLFCTGHYLMTSIAKGGFIQANLSESFTSFPFFIPGYSIFHVVNNAIHSDGKRLWMPFFGTAIMNGLAVWRKYCGLKKYQEYKAVFHHLADRMQDVQCLLKAMQQLSNLIAAHPELEALYRPYLQEIYALLQPDRKPIEVSILVNNLLHMPLDNCSYFFGNAGKLLATYNLFEAHRTDFHAAMYALGQLDCFISIATLVEETHAKHPEHPYTFTKFLDRSQHKTPYIRFNAMWHPLLDSEKVIDNEVEMDVHTTRNMILCGPNAGGKSSFLSGVASSLLLSQTLGIAPAKNALLTPFDKIRTYIEVGDSIASGASRFMVEVERMQKHIDDLTQSKPDEFVFAVADELFSGTNPIEGSAAAYSTIACIAKYTNALHIISSHYPIVMALEQHTKGRGIRNFKVFVEENPDHTLHYTYKIIPGKTTQTVALKLLEQKGYDKELLHQAQHMVLCPEKFYHSKQKDLRK